MYDGRARGPAVNKPLKGGGGGQFVPIGILYRHWHYSYIVIGKKGFYIYHIVIPWCFMLCWSTGQISRPNAK